MHWIRWGMALALAVGACTSEETNSIGSGGDTTGMGGSTTRGSTSTGGSTSTTSSGAGDGTGGTATNGGASAGERAHLVLHDEDGEPVFDEDWGECLFDTRTSEKQLALLETVGDWIDGCAMDGFDAVEIDNLDSYSRSGGLLTEDDNVSFMARLAAVAHEHDLAIGQKNSAELVPRARELGTDFAGAEECNRYDECADYQAHYGNLVFVIEYREQDFRRGCSDFPELSIVLRDLNVTTPGSSSYVFYGC